MYQVFNMGHRMELYVEPSIADDIIEISKNFLGSVGIFSGKYNPRSGAKPFFTAPANELYLEL